MKTDQEIMREFYDFAASEPGFVGDALTKLGIDDSEAARRFDIVDSEALARLKGFSLPRQHRLEYDAPRIARACGAGNSQAFLEAMREFFKLQ
jgi:hypothetical protein